MNTQSITRKQELRIDCILDYVDWAWAQINSGIEEGVLFKLTHFDGQIHPVNDHDVDMLAAVRKVYVECLVIMGIDPPSISYDHSAEAETIRKIYFETRQYKDDLYVIDIRPISYFEPNSSSISILDQMAITCGFLPQHENWIKHSEDRGKSDLKSMFKFTHTHAVNTVVMSDTAVTLLADSYLSNFQEPTYYLRQKPIRLEPTYDVDHGVILHDEKNIGMIVTVTTIG